MNISDSVYGKIMTVVCLTQEGDRFCECHRHEFLAWQRCQLGSELGVLEDVSELLGAGRLDKYPQLLLVT